MKYTSQIMSIAALIGCAAMASGVANAQTQNNAANVPFSFVANGVRVNAGRIEITRVSDSISSLSSKNGGALDFLSGRNRTEGPGHLTFYRYGNQYFLREIDEDGGVVSKIPVSPRERETMQTAETAAAKVEVTLVASR